jgi:BirA family transcriptional regulator, biotin operon repressor / biotin---[acetyl-CoA-carboxylase] ligase
MAANAARKALEDQTNLRIKVKWPNDLILETGKIGGILIEAKTIGEQVLFVVVGIGLNINLTVRQLPLGAKSAYVETKTRYDNRKLLRRIIERMSSEYANLKEPMIIVNEWWRQCVHRDVRVEMTLRDKTLAGITRGLDEDGSLILETDRHKIVRVGDGTLRLLDCAFLSLPLYASSASAAPK